MGNSDEIPKHWNLPVISNIEMIFEVIIAFLIKDDNPKKLNSTQLANIVSSSSSPIPNITRFLKEIGIIEFEKAGNYLNYYLSSVGEEIARDIINQESELVFLKFADLLPKYLVVEKILTKLGDQSKEYLDFCNFIAKDLGISEKKEYRVALDHVLRLMISANIIHINKNDIIQIEPQSDESLNKKISIENIYLNLVEKRKLDIEKEFIPDKENIFHKKIHHHHLSRMSDPIKIFKVLSAFKNDGFLSLKNVDVALKLSRSPSANIKNIRFLGAMGLIVKGKIGRQDYYRLTPEGEFAAEAFNKGEHGKIYKLIKKLLPNYYVGREILVYIKNHPSSSHEDIFSFVSTKLEIDRNNKEYMTGLKTLIYIMESSELIFSSSNSQQDISPSSVNVPLFFPDKKDKTKTKIRRKIRLSLLKASRIINNNIIGEDAHSIFMNYLIDKKPFIVPIEQDPDRFFILNLHIGRSKDYIEGKLAIVKKDDLPGAVSTSTLEFRGLPIEDDEGIYLPIHFVLQKYGRFLVTASEFYRFGPKFRSLPLILDVILAQSFFKFNLHFLIDKTDFQNLDRFNRINSLEVRFATKNWDERLSNISPIKGLDYLITELRDFYGDINVTIRFSAKRNKSLTKLKKQFISLKEFVKVGKNKKVIKKALIEGKTDLDEEGHFDMLYDKIIVSEDVKLDQDDARMVAEDSIFEKLYNCLEKNNKFIARTMPNENIEEN